MDNWAATSATVKSLLTGGSQKNDRGWNSLPDTGAIRELMSGGVRPAHQSAIQLVDHSQSFTTFGTPSGDLNEARNLLLQE